MDILTPKHNRWHEFTSRLGGSEACDFREDGTWKCKGGIDKTFSTSILTDMGGIDVPATLEYFTKHGGHCDCEVLFNVDR